MSLQVENLTFDFVKPHEIPLAFEVEQKGFPSDEAASLAALQYRQQHAPELFLGAFLPSASPEERHLIGYITSTLSSSATLTHDSMSHHDPGGQYICIHSVCVDPEYRRRSVALRLLEEYTRRARDSGRWKTLLLITHEELRGLYEKAGFSWVGKSEVQHGAREWYEMRRDL